MLYGTYGSRKMRLLIVNYIWNNQSIFENHVDIDFNDYKDKMELDKTWGTYTEYLHSLQFLKLIYDNIQWVRPLISIKKKSNKGTISLLYSKWFHYDALYPLEKKEIISFDKSKISKVKYDTISVRFLLKMMKNKIIVMNFYK